MSSACPVLLPCHQMKAAHPAHLPSLTQMSSTIILTALWKIAILQECKFGLSSPLCFDCGIAASSQHLQAINIKHCEIWDTITLPSLDLNTYLWQICGWQNLTFKSFYSMQFYLVVCWNFQSAHWKNNASIMTRILSVLKGSLTQRGGAHRLYGKTWCTPLGQSWSTVLGGDAEINAISHRDWWFSRK